MNPPDVVLSRHRLPRSYRFSLTLLWLAPGMLFLFTLFVSHGAVFALLDPRLVIPLLLMAFPAWHVWQQGVDVCRDGVIVRVHVPRYHPYPQLKRWGLQTHPQGRILTITQHNDRLALSYHAGHLSDLSLLLLALQHHLGPGYPQA